ncbi:MAG: RNA polymerase sigma factor [Deltaproteobacteria bacterium]|nr:RNA polymerase sigma factor [Deltaproteobacteria bacterium]
MGPADLSQLARLRARDPDATAETLRALVPHVRRWLYRLLGRSPDLDDATQDALAEIAGFLPRFEGRAKLETVAYQITVRVAYRYFARHRDRDVSLEVVPELVDVGAGTESRVMAREALARLHRCLNRLPAKRRIAFVLCAIDGLAPRDAARIAGTTAIAMRCRLTFARREIARMLRGDPYLAGWLERDAREEDEA